MVVIHVQVMRTPNISAVDLLRVLESLAVRRLLMSRLVGFSIPEDTPVVSLFVLQHTTVVVQPCAKCGTL